MNGAVEAANKNIKRILGKMTNTYKDWHEKLPFALLAYRTSIRTSTGATPFSLVYGMEVVLSIKVEISSLKVLMEIKLDEAEWVQDHFEQLNLIEEKKLSAFSHGQMPNESRIQKEGVERNFGDFLTPSDHRRPPPAVTHMAVDGVHDVGFRRKPENP
ncbi:uncharacterized protein LOC111276391 [Durio zibethinus]|uniref:Uncharacterized protein LOC111276391 n=1 Tax=Durio zibethinus TaxID=66656 RepID=A0A6P5WPB8_DURZI|nr:uncharacterized protein LOC111276391 [Durio zibethinus]